MNVARKKVRDMAERLTDEDAAEVVRFIRWLSGDDAETLTPAENDSLDRGIAQAKAGRTRPWREVRRISR
jgi:hypothetical protein